MKRAALPAENGSAVSVRLEDSRRRSSEPPRDNG